MQIVVSPHRCNMYITLEDGHCEIIIQDGVPARFHASLRNGFHATNVDGMSFSNFFTRVNTLSPTLI